MADLVIPAVTATRCAKRTVAQAGEAGSKGNPLYHKQSDGKWYKADASFLESAGARGVATHDFTAGNPVIIATGGDLDVGVATVDGTVYVVSATAGGICPWTDLLTGEIVTIVGIGIAGNFLKLNICRSLTAKP